MKAVVMAGGEGSRLRPLTCNLPKPMVSVGNRPILDHVLSLLARHGFEEALLTLHHLPQAIRDHVGDGAAFGLRVRHFVEDVPLGTAGSVKNVEPELGGEPFLVISGDVLTDIDLGAVVAFHRRRGALVTIALTSVETPLEYGVVVCDKDGRVRRFIEKPSWGEVVSDRVNTGVYVLEPEALQLFEAGRVFDFSRQLFPLLLEAGRPVFGFAAPGYWCDVGNLGQYLQSHIDILEGRTGLEIDGTLLEEKVWAGPGVELGPRLELSGPVLLGPGTYVGAEVRLEGPSVIGREGVIGGQASVKRSVLGDHCYVGRLAEVRGAILGRGVRLHNRTRVFDGAVLADEVRVGEETIVKPGVKIWPGRAVAPAPALGAPILWGQAWGYGVFGEGEVTGEVNVDLRPETAARLGAVFGAGLPLRARVVLAVDAGPGPGLIRDALTSGLGLAGCAVSNCGELPAVAARYATRALGATAGVHVGGEGARCVIRFFDHDGLDLSREAVRRLERALGGEDFRRAPSDRLGEVRYSPGLSEAYLAHLEARGRDLARKGMVVAGAYANPWFEARAPGLWRTLDVRHVQLAARGEVDAPASGAADVVRREHAAFAFELDAAGEVVTLMDDLGRRLSRAQAWLVLSGASAVGAGTGLAVPSDLPRTVAERLAALGARPVPCHAGRSAVMAEMRRLERDAGPAPFRQSEMVYGGLLGAIGLLAHLADAETSLAEIVDRSPLGEWVHLRVACPWDIKGRVMRLLHEENPSIGGGVEGVQAEARGGRVVVLPDADRPAFHVYSEAADLEVAEELVGLYARRVTELAGLDGQARIPRPGGQL